MPATRNNGQDHACHAESDTGCVFCESVLDDGDTDWLCLCTAAPRRVHWYCLHERGKKGTVPCPACGLTNQYNKLSSARRKARVVVIGGGPAGLAAMHQLRSCGLKPRLLEARTRLGGRILTTRMGESPIDLGAAYIHGCDAMYNTVYRLASTVGARVDQSAGGYSAGWGVNAPWYDATTGRRINQARPAASTTRLPARSSSKAVSSARLRACSRSSPCLRML